MELNDTSALKHQLKINRKEKLICRLQVKMLTFVLRPILKMGAYQKTHILNIKDL